MSSYACRCCGFWTLSKQATGTFEICRVCDWEDDPIQNDDPSYEGGANTRSLRQAWQMLFDASPRDPVLVEVPGWLEPDRLNSDEPYRQILLAGIARSMLRGTIEILLGCLEIARIASRDCPAGPLRSIKAVASEVDELPRGSVRALWAPQALALKDAEWVFYEAQVRSSVLADCQRLIAELRQYRILR